MTRAGGKGGKLKKALNGAQENLVSIQNLLVFDPVALAISTRIN